MKENLRSKLKAEKSRGYKKKQRFLKTHHLGFSETPSFWQKRLWTNKDQKRQRQSLHNSKGINSMRRANYPKYICTQYRSSRFIKQFLRDLQRDLDSHTIIVGDLNTPLSTVDRSVRQEYSRLKLRSGSSVPDSYTQNSPFKNNRIYIFLSTTSHLS